MFRTFRPGAAGRGDPAGPRPSRPARGNWLRFAQFAAVGGLPDPVRSPPFRSWQDNWLRLYQRSQRRFRRRPRPSASAAVARGELASFRTPSFGVPRLRGSDRSFPPQGGTGTPNAICRVWEPTPNGPRSPLGYLVSAVGLRRGCVLTRSRRNPPKSWSLIRHALFCCPVIIRTCQFLVK